MVGWNGSLAPGLGHLRSLASQLSLVFVHIKGQVQSLKWEEVGQQACWSLI
jgi:hypothetical protein